MKKFELLGKSLSKDQQQRIKGGDETVGGGQTCYATCPNGKKWGLDCTGDCSESTELPGYIVCNSQYYNYGC
ncbi:MAG: hypothetical protein K2Q24_05060 [Chitinophagaceae bacterium]|nr:hypothetical protein [Chitinophagaceae bacterium]